MQDDDGWSTILHLVKSNLHDFIVVTLSSRYTEPDAELVPGIFFVPENLECGPIITRQNMNKQIFFSLGSIAWD